MRHSDQRSNIEKCGLCGPEDAGVRDTREDESLRQGGPGVQAGDAFQLALSYQYFCKDISSNIFVLIFEVQESPYDKNQTFLLS